MGHCTLATVRGSYNDFHGEASLARVKRRQQGNIQTLPNCGEILDLSLLTTAKAWLCILVAVCIIRLASLRYHHGLHKYNGPFLASLTDFQRLCHAYSTSYRKPMILVDDKYGDILNMGPDVLSFRQPQAIRDIYGPGKHSKKVS